MEMFNKIRDVYRSIVEYQNQFEKEYNLSLNEGAMLLLLTEENRLSSGEIAQKMGLSLSNTSKVIKSVESKRLVKRIMGVKDRRQMYFMLAAEGKKKVNVILGNSVELPQLLNNAMRIS